MSFFAIVLALMMEQVRPMPLRAQAQGLAEGWMRWCLRGLDAGARQHGWLLWVCAVALPSVLCWAVHALLLWGGSWLGAVLAFAWSVAVLFCTLGFRQFSHHFTTIRQALEDGDLQQAAELLAQWRGQETSPADAQHIICALMDQGTIAAHRHVFAVLGWYAVFAALGLGPAGAVMYRMAALLAQMLRVDGLAGTSDSQAEIASEQAVHAPMRDMASESSRHVVRRSWHGVDYLSARATALAFAVVGNFEEVLESWRNHSLDDKGLGNDALIKLAMRASLGLGESSQLEHLRSLVGLMWRSVVLWLLLIALLSVARLLG